MGKRLVSCFFLRHSVYIYIYIYCLLLAKAAIPFLMTDEERMSPDAGLLDAASALYFCALKAN